MLRFDFFFRVLLYRMILRDSMGPRTFLYVIVRDPKATLDWSVLDPALEKIFGPKAASEDWSDFFQEYTFDWDAKCPSFEGVSAENLNKSVSF